MVKTRIRTMLRHFGQEKLRYLKISISIERTVLFCSILGVSLALKAGRTSSIQPALTQIIAQQTSCLPELLFNCINGSVKYFGDLF